MGQLPSISLPFRTISTYNHKMADTEQKVVEEVPAAQAEEVSEEPKVTEVAETTAEAAEAEESAEGPTEAADESEAATEEEATEAPAEAEPSEQNALSLYFCTAEHIFVK